MYGAYWFCFYFYCCCYFSFFAVATTAKMEIRIAHFSATITSTTSAPSLCLIFSPLEAPGLVGWQRRLERELVRNYSTELSKLSVRNEQPATQCRAEKSYKNNNNINKCGRGWMKLVVGRRSNYRVGLIPLHVGVKVAHERWPMAHIHKYIYIYECALPKWRPQDPLARLNSQAVCKWLSGWFVATVKFGCGSHPLVY